jgi:hypothetical protein
MPATVIAERIGLDRGMTVFKQRVAELRPASLPPDPASCTTYEAGELAQFDFWFPDIELPVDYGQTRTAKRLPEMTCVTGYSRWSGGILIPSREADDLYAGWWHLLSTQLQGVPRRWCGTAKEPLGGGAHVDPSSPVTARRSVGSWVRVCASASPPTLKPRGCSSGCMTTSRGPSCPDGVSRRRAGWTE